MNYIKVSSIAAKSTFLSVLQRNVILLTFLARLTHVPSSDSFRLKVISSQRCIEVKIIFISLFSSDLLEQVDIVDQRKEHGLYIVAIQCRSLIKLHLVLLQQHIQGLSIVLSEWRKQYLAISFLLPQMAITHFSPLLPRNRSIQLSRFSNV